MVTQTKKLLAAGVVLAAGLGLAWPLRRTGPALMAPVEAQVPATSAQAPALEQPAPLQTAVPARMTGLVAVPDAPTRVAPVTPQRFDPPASRAQEIAPREDATESQPAPSAAPDDSSATDDDLAASPERRIHVVHNGDTLERLAKRYLGNEGRALEVFDLNRDVLTNPHLLPIGAELRIPTAANRDAAE